MDMDLAEWIYRLIGLAVIATALGTMLWIHRGFYSDTLIHDPQSLSDGQLRRILAWGKIIHRRNSDTAKGEEILERMRLALAEIRRRRD